jgi:hypothetical protein
MRFIYFFSIIFLFSACQRNTESSLVFCQHIQNNNCVPPLEINSVLYRINNPEKTSTIENYLSALSDQNFCWQLSRSSKKQYEKLQLLTADNESCYQLIIKSKFTGCVPVKELFRCSLKNMLNLPYQKIPEVSIKCRFSYKEYTYETLVSLVLK